VTPTTAKLLSGHTKSCGCYARDKNTVHGMHKTTEYVIWTQMKERCHRPGTAKYDRYGARGIYVCAAWRASFAAFFRDMGPRPSKLHTVERNDNDGPYAPSNCRWALWKDQYRNRRQNVWIEHEGKRRCQKDWCAEYGVDAATFAQRIARGWDVQTALTARPYFQFARLQRKPSKGETLDQANVLN